LPALVLLAFLVAQLPLLAVGLAHDSGAVRRTAGLVVRPVAPREHAPPDLPHPADRRQGAWVRCWEPGTEDVDRPRSSTWLLWKAFATGSRAAGARALDLGLMAIAIRTLSFVASLFVVWWVVRDVPRPGFLAATLTAGAFVLHVDVECAAHQASLSFSGGFSLFLFLMVAALQRARAAPRPETRAGAVVASLLAGAVHGTTVPLAGIGTYLALRVDLAGAPRGRRLPVRAACVAAALLATVAALASVRSPWHRVTAYHGVFCGALSFSERPGDHVRRLGFAHEHEALVGRDASDPAAARFLRGPEAERLGLCLPLRVYLDEPGAGIRALAAVGDAFHERVPSLRRGDRAQPLLDEVPGRFLYGGLSGLSRALAPAGMGHWLLCGAVLALLHGWKTLRASAGAFAARVFLWSSAAMAVVAVAVGGRWELTPHLFYARLAWLAGTGLTLTLVLHAAIARVRPRF